MKPNFAWTPKASQGQGWLEPLNALQTNHQKTQKDASAWHDSHHRFLGDASKKWFTDAFGQTCNLFASHWSQLQNLYCFCDFWWIFGRFAQIEVVGTLPNSPLSSWNELRILWSSYFLILLLPLGRSSRPCFGSFKDVFEAAQVGPLHCRGLCFATAGSWSCWTHEHELRASCLQAWKLLCPASKGLWTPQVSTPLETDSKLDLELSTRKPQQSENMNVLHQYRFCMCLSTFVRAPLMHFCVFFLCVPSARVIYLLSGAWIVSSLINDANMPQSMSLELDLLHLRIFLCEQYLCVSRQHCFTGDSNLINVQC